MIHITYFCLLLKWFLSHSQGVLLIERIYERRDFRRPYSITILQNLQELPYTSSAAASVFITSLEELYPQ